MRNIIPLLFVCLGLLVAFIATLAGYANGSIHPDSTLQMYIVQNAALRKYNLIALVGLIVCLSGVVWIGARVLKKRRRKIS